MTAPRTTTGIFKARGRNARSVSNISAESAHDSPREPTTEPAGRVPRVARLMALAIRLDELIKKGAVPSQAEVAVLGHVTRARVTQIMNLLHLAPDIQEQILHLPPVTRGRDPITERDLRPVAAIVDWTHQRDQMYREHLPVPNCGISTS